MQTPTQYDSQGKPVTSPVASDSMPTGLLKSVGSIGAQNAISAILSPSVTGATAAAPFGVMTDAAGQAIGTMAPNLGAGAAGAAQSSFASGLQSLGIGADTAGSLAQGAGALGKIAAPIGAIYGGYKLSQGLLGSGNDYRDPKGGAMAGATAGAGIGSMILPGVGTLIGGLIGALSGAGLEMTGGGKSKDQLIRDKQREAWRKAGLVDGGEGGKGALLKLGNGREFDLGLDGSSWAGKSDKFDYQNPLNQQAIKWLDGASLLLSGGNEKIASDWTRALANNFTNNGAADVNELRDNTYELYKKIGMSPSQVIAELDKMRGTKISDEKYQVLVQGINELRKGAPMPVLPQVQKAPAPSVAPVAPGAPTAPAPSQAAPLPTGGPIVADRVARQGPEQKPAPAGYGISGTLPVGGLSNLGGRFR